MQYLYAVKSSMGIPAFFLVENAAQLFMRVSDISRRHSEHMKSFIASHPECVNDPAYGVRVEQIGTYNLETDEFSTDVFTSLPDYVIYADASVVGGT